MTPSKRQRKQARSLIYRAFYGVGGKFCNDPSQHGTRIRAQDWSLEDMLYTVRHNWHAARFSPRQAHNLLDDINGTLRIRGQNLLTLAEFQS